MMSRYVFLFEEVKRMAGECDSKYKNTRPCKDDLYEFLDYNDWFGMMQRGKGNDIEVALNQRGMEALSLWLNGYKQKAGVKTALLIDAYKAKYPRTVNALKKYIEDGDLQDENYVYQTLDFLLYTIASDDEVFDDEKSQQLLQKGVNELSLAAGTFISDFISEVNKHTGKWEYRFEKRKLETNNDAYDFRSFVVMAYCVFNTESWKANRMIEKAVVDQRSADLWLWIALHFIAALRTSDIKRLPVPMDTEDHDDVISGLLAGEYEEMAEKTARQWSMQLQFMMTVPSKTSGHSDVPNIKVFIPESLMIPFGVMLLVNRIHHKSEEQLLTVNNEFYLLKGFFGDRFMEVCGGRRFSSRRANKAYLQGIEALGSDGTNAKGYMLAALARSHKGGIGSLPETTDVYLRDENFSGYKPEFILREMFERGIFGFIPVMLLRLYDEENFLKIDVHSQTQLIKQIGLDGYQLECITDKVDQALVRVKECTAAYVLNHYVSGDREAVGGLLEKLVAECAPAKQPEYFCLRIAAGDKCACPDRGSCLGCGYEVYTKASLNIVVKEFHRLYKSKENGDSFEEKRCRSLLEKVLVPAITQMLASMKTLYKTDMEESIMMDILEGGIRNDHSDGE